MQASLKLNTKNTEYVLLTISNLEDQALPPSKEASMQHDYLNDSNITHSRVTHGRYDQPQSDRIIEHRQEPESLPAHPPCAACCAWKQWAIQQQKIMLKLEEDLLSREIALREAIGQLTKQLQQKSRTIQQYGHQLVNSKQQINRLSHQLIQNQMHMQDLIKEKQSNQPSAYATPFKNEVCSHRLEADKGIASTKMSQLLTDEKKGQTCTTATKNNLEWSAFDTHLEKTYKQNTSKTKSQQIDKYLFENTMLKEYNSVLLQRLKESKYRKPF